MSGVETHVSTHVFCNRSVGAQMAGSCPRHAGRPLQKSAVCPLASGAGQNRSPTPSGSCLSPLTIQERHKKTKTNKKKKNNHLNCLTIKQFK